MTHSGPAGSPEGVGPLLTRREARAQREAAEASTAAAATAETAAETPTAEAVDTPPAPTTVIPAVPVPPVPVLSVSPDLAVVVESASTPTSDLGPQSSASAPTAPTSPVPPHVGRLRPVRLRSVTAAPTSPAGARTSRPVKRRKSVAKIVTLLAIPAIFLTAALPAYAFSPQGGSALVSAKASGDTQALTVAAAAAAVSISADGFTATSQAELDDIEAGIQADLVQQQAAEDARAAAADYAVIGIRAEGDDYPWREAATESQGGGLSPLGYYYRECVDFVAWRLNRDAGATSSFKWTWSTMTPGGGNASAWANAWSNKGWASSKAPVVGAVAWFTYNHVAYVQSVPGDGTVVLEEYNWMGSHAYHTRTVPISEVPVYLYPPT
ncbi:CHAP domain-containing protein [Cryobacterium lactosi]|uniref:CHAP domain-containing protein n=1 Tax=Cryobacterium lactosi TaxID=1259202 RepID=A0A4R9C1I8_9MICO|nr:CHAP domain-containing protein [Cryobacterium lactosi]TFD95219.1 CHAP domain-containing protein [Cryobacterium lactosi]